MNDKRAENTEQSSARTQRKKKSAPKDSQLLIRINGEERDRFVDLCEELDTSAARELRRFIRRFLQDHAD